MLGCDREHGDDDLNALGVDGGASEKPNRCGGLTRRVRVCWGLGLYERDDNEVDLEDTLSEELHWSCVMASRTRCCGCCLEYGFGPLYGMGFGRAGEGCGDRVVVAIGIEHALRYDDSLHGCRPRCDLVEKLNEEEGGMAVVGVGGAGGEEMVLRYLVIVFCLSSDVVELE